MKKISNHAGSNATLNGNKRKRNREQIIASILRTARNGAPKTRIMYMSFLSLMVLNKYLGYVIHRGFLYLDARTGKYLTTDKGLEYLRSFEEMHELETNYFEKKQIVNGLLDISDGQP